MNRGKIAIIGVGHVGSSIAYSLIIAKLANLILLSGSHPDKLWAEKKELLQYATVSGIVVEIETCDIEACKEADIIVIAASKKYIHGMDRDDFLLSSSCIVSQICSKLDGYTGVTTIVTNPVDFITYFSCKAFGLDRKRVIGAGTIIDSYRLRTTLRCRNNLWCIGEHGGLSFVPLKMQKNLQYDKEVYHHTIIKNNKEANEIMQIKGKTNWAIAGVIIQLIDTIINDSKLLLPVSQMLNFDFLNTEICIGYPSYIGKSGIIDIADIPLSPEEKQIIYTIYTKQVNLYDKVEREVMNYVDVD